MKKIKAVHFDADGVLITGGDFYSTPDELKDAVGRLRESGVLFNMASGRPLFEQEELFKIITDNSEPQENEGILYEASAVKLWHSEEKHQVGGLTPNQIDKVESFLIQHGLVTGMVPQQNNRRYETQTGYVTPTFRSQGITDTELLRLRYSTVKSAVEEKFPFAKVDMSADAIDILAKGGGKDKPTIKYAEITGIPFNQTGAIGDSGGDIPMLRVVGKGGGIIGYVGDTKGNERIMVVGRGGDIIGNFGETNEETMSKIRTIYGNQFFPIGETGPQGTVQFIDHIIARNKVIDQGWQQDY